MLHSTAEEYNIFYALGVTPSVIFGDTVLPSHLQWIPAPLTAITHMFLHGGWMHLLGNLWYLWIFGNNIEDAMGHTKFILFYIACGFVAVIAQAIPDLASTVPMIGASGAISGILGAYLVLYPRAIITILVPIFIYPKFFHVQAKWVLGAWFFLQLFLSIFSGSGSDGGVAFAAHIGGFIGGMLLCPLFKHRYVPLALFKPHNKHEE